MKTVLLFKLSRDPQDARMSIGAELTWGNAKLSASDDDPAAMQVAKAISGDDEVIALTIGDGDSTWAAARGASSTIIIEDLLDDADVSRTASAIKAAIDADGGADAVIVGDTEWNKGLVVALIAELGIPAFAGVVSAQRADDAYRIACKSGSVTKTIEAKPPFMLAVRGLSSEREVPSMKQVLQARKKPQVKTTAEQLEGVRGIRATQDRTFMPDSNPVVMIDGTDPSEAAHKLIEALKHRGVL